MADYLAITPGEPAGIGPDICLQLAAAGEMSDCVAIADPDLLAERASLLGLDVQLCLADCEKAPANTLRVDPVPCAYRSPPGEASPENAIYIMETLRRAAVGSKQGKYKGMVTGPIHKGVINDAGFKFSGHTEYLAELVGGDPVMMLATDQLRVALATTHLPLSEVPEAITAELLVKTIGIIDHDLRRRFGIETPNILVCGLNPHAGEDGHLGREEIEIIEPALKEVREQGINAIGPIPADTAFVPHTLKTADAVLAMYHDQGLPVLKHDGFGKAINITLGLPIVRTSVDHGTAFELAGTGNADLGSLRAALKAARHMTE